MAHIWTDDWQNTADEWHLYVPTREYKGEIRKIISNSFGFYGTHTSAALELEGA